MYRCIAATALALVFTLPAWAQTQRPFPPNAMRGQVVFGQPPDMVLNGKPARLAPGHQVRNQQNLLEMSAALPDVKAVVNYTLDAQGQIKLVWLLREEEVANKPWPSTTEQLQSWRFDAAAQSWSKP
jgi:hypothetical protein